MLKVNAQTGEIFVYDVIGADWFGEGITASSVTSALAEIGSAKRAVVRINSPGGSADEGIAIYNALKRHKAGVDTYNDSLAASAASMIFMAGDNRYAAKGSRVMIHRAWTIAGGNSTEMAKVSATLGVYDKSQAEIYSEYLGLTQEETLALLDAETWYTSEEAIAAGLATAIDGNKKADKPKTASWFKHAPAALFEDRTLASNRFDYDLANVARLRFATGVK